MIPPEKKDAVTRGLLEAFGITECDDMQMIKDLAASMVYRIVVRGTPYLLKISLRTNDPARHYATMRAAAEAGLAPRVLYSSTEDKVSIEDFVTTAHFPVSEALVRVAALLRALHALPPFPAVPPQINTSCLFLMGDAAAGFLQQFRATNILTANQNEEFFSRHAELAAVYTPLGEDMVSSHNDLFKPDNMLFDGQRLWLVDWEAAFLNDQYADLAVVANMIVTNEGDEKVFLEEYFGEPPDAYQSARFFLMQQLAHLFYTMAFLWQGAAGKPIDWSEPLPEYNELQRRFWMREFELTDNHSKIIYGRVHWEQLLNNVQQPRYAEALRIVSGRHATA
jgi:thiamine kinase-like enzyme